MSVRVFRNRHFLDEFARGADAVRSICFFSDGVAEVMVATWGHEYWWPMFYRYGPKDVTPKILLPKFIEIPLEEVLAKERP